MKTIKFINIKFLLLIIPLIISYSAGIAQMTTYPDNMVLESITCTTCTTNYYYPTKIISPEIETNAVSISGSSKVTYTAGDQIELNPGFEAGDFTGDGEFTAQIDTGMKMILISPDPNDPYTFNNNVVQVHKWEKFEVGFNLPKEYLVAVKNFFDNYDPKLNGLDHSFTGPMLNPYADDSLSVEVDLTSPDYRQITKWAFFMRVADFLKEIDSGHDPNYEKVRLDDNSSDPLRPFNWRFRFAPDYEGTWTFNITINTANDISTGLPIYGFPTYHFNNFQFECIARLAENHGFLKVNQSNKRYLQFDDNTPFFGIGENVADIMHYNTSDHVLLDNTSVFLKLDFNDYNSTFDEMHSAGANYARIFMLPGNFAVEWQNLGVYDIWDANDISNCHAKTGCCENGNRQYNLWAFDKLVEKAHDNGIYIQLCVDPYPPIVDYQDYIWGDHAYSRLTYDPSSMPYPNRTDILRYFTNDNSYYTDGDKTTTSLRGYWKRRYKYIMSRYGYSVNIAAIESFNEIDQVLGYKDRNVTSTSICPGNQGHWDEISGLRTLIDEWHTDILGYAKGTLMGNANKHLTTVSIGPYYESGNSNNPLDANEYTLFNNVNIDMFDIHQYVNGNDRQCFVEPFNTSSKAQVLFPNNPFHFGEFMAPGLQDIPGHHDTWSCNLFNNYDISFHNELWASTFMGNFSTGLNWAWNVVHWWPNSNPIKLFYGPGDFDYISINNGINDPNEINDRNDVPIPGTSIPKTIINKKIYHNFKPLSDFITQSEIDFTQNYTPHSGLENNMNIESYYLVNSNKNMAYGWLHNLNSYWYNKYYYYYLDANHDWESSNCNFSSVSQGLLLQGFNSNSSYLITFYPTRLPDPNPNQIQVVPPPTLTCTVDLLNQTGLLFIPENIFNDYFDNSCDTSLSDFAFVISEISGAKIAQNPGQNTSVLIDTSYLIKNGFIKSNLVNENNNNNFTITITPNPSSGIFNVSINGFCDFEKINEICIYDVRGNLLFKKQNIKTTSVDLSNNPNGVYFLKVSSNSSIKYFKLIRS